MPILIGIDGTGGGTIPGSKRDARYDIDFANSFVSELCKFIPNAIDGRRPVTIGGGLDIAIYNSLKFIESKRKELGENEPILVTGYSRGALGTMVVAQRLQRENLKVRAAMLFDCVDRHGDYDAEVVPNNVENILHVVRNPKAKSRHSFGNDAMKYRMPTKYEGPFMYMCTHGGMGGTPWQKPYDKQMTDLIDEGASEEFYNKTTAVTYQQDADVSRGIWNDCQIFLRNHRFID